MSEYKVRSSSPLRQRSGSPHVPQSAYGHQPMNSGGFSSHQKGPITSLRRPLSQEKSTRVVLSNQKSQQQEEAIDREFTEVFSWGNDKSGQLGLGQRLSQGKQMHPNPRFCSYNIPISMISCGQGHSVFITTNNLVYSMGSNNSGQLGINDPYISCKYSPVLIESLLDKSPLDVKCGDVHTLVLCRNGDVYSWGNNDYGQCGCGNTGTGNLAVLFSPRLVYFESYYRPNIQQIDCGSEHSAFVDDIGRLFTCGRSQNGQLGLGYFTDEMAPIYVNKIPDKIMQVACGQLHTIGLTVKGEVYVMGANTQGQLGTGPPSKGSPIPIFLEELSFSRIVRIKAGQFSAALSIDQQLFVWGRGIFGEFYTPHRVKSANKLDILDFQLSKGGSAFILTKEGSIYSWGFNDFGQLGHGDYKDRQTFEKIVSLEGKQVSQIAVGNEFTIALGLTMAQKEYIKMAKQASGLLQQNPSTTSAKSQKTNGKSLQRQRSKRAKSVTKRNGGSSGIDFNNTMYSSNYLNANSKRKEFLSGERDKILREVFNNQDIGGPPAVNVKHQKKSKSSQKLSSVPAVSKISFRKNRETNSIYGSSHISASHRKSPLRSARGVQIPRFRQPDSQKQVMRMTSNSEDRSLKKRDCSRERSRDAKSTGKKENPPIIISNDDAFHYKAPSSIHETVVTTLRKEKDQLVRALTNQRETTQSYQDKITQMSIRIQELESRNLQLEAIQQEDKKALIQLDEENGRTREDYSHIRSRLQEMEDQLGKARLNEDDALKQAERAAADVANYKQDISVLTRETQRLNEEIRELLKTKANIEDDLHKTEVEFTHYREEEYNRNQSMHLEMEHLRNQREAKSTEVDNLRDRVDDLQRRKAELSSQLDFKVGDSHLITKDFQAVQEQNKRLVEENNDLRFRVRDLTDKNNELELRLNRSLVDRSVAIERIQTAQAQEKVHREARVERALQVLRHNEDVLLKERERSREILDRSQERLNNSSSFPTRQEERSSSPLRNEQVVSDPGVSRIVPEYEGRRSSPLRSRSPQRSPPQIAAVDNHERMKKSQERIAAILGMDKSSNHKDMPQNQSLQQLLESKREGRYSGYKRDGGSPLRTQIHERSRSPNDTSGMVESRGPSALGEEAVTGSYSNQIQSSMVKQSLADLKNRLNLMRREKQQVDQELNNYENRA